MTWKYMYDKKHGFKPGDKVIVNNQSYKDSEFKNGDILVLLNRHYESYVRGFLWSANPYNKEFVFTDFKDYVFEDEIKPYIEAQPGDKVKVINNLFELPDIYLNKTYILEKLIEKRGCPTEDLWETKSKKRLLRCEFEVINK